MVYAQGLEDGKLYDMLQTMLAKLLHRAARSDTHDISIVSAYDLHT